jgi:hypothetical protein
MHDPGLEGVRAAYATRAVTQNLAAVGVVLVVAEFRLKPVEKRGPGRLLVTQLKRTQLTLAEGSQEMDQLSRGRLPSAVSRTADHPVQTRGLIRSGVDLIWKARSYSACWLAASDRIPSASATP